MTKQQLRALWFQVHKWLGLSLAILIIPISLTGAVLVWHEPLETALHPQRKANGRAQLPAAAYATAARSHAGAGDRLSSLAFEPDGGAVVATLSSAPTEGGGRPLRTMLYLHPRDARLLDSSRSDEGIFQFMHRLHGSLLIAGAGRSIVGWIGVAMLLSSLTGLWLWWPLNGRLVRGLRWKRNPATSSNLHYQGGFWICIPLAVLSFTGAWISFPAFFASLSGDPPGPSPAERLRRIAAQPLAEARLTPDEAIGLAGGQATGPVMQVTWPTGPKGEWKVSYQRPGGAAEVTVDDRSQQVTPARPPRPETKARLMRRIHDGTNMGLIWQLVIFLGGIIPAVLAITGILMWLRIRRGRSGRARLVAEAA